MTRVTLSLTKHNITVAVVQKNVMLFFSEDVREARTITVMIYYYRASIKLYFAN